jgi:hypothetical protein
VQIGDLAGFAVFADRGLAVAVGGVVGEGSQAVAGQVASGVQLVVDLLAAGGEGLGALGGVQTPQSLACTRGAYTRGGTHNVHVIYYRNYSELLSIHVGKVIENLGRIRN